jgi:hypothetical protein
MQLPVCRAITALLWPLLVRMPSASATGCKRAVLSRPLSCACAEQFELGLFAIATVISLGRKHYDVATCMAQPGTLHHNPTTCSIAPSSMPWHQLQRLPLASKSHPVPWTLRDGQASPHAAATGRPAEKRLLPRANLQWQQQQQLQQRRQWQSHMAGHCMPAPCFLCTAAHHRADMHVTRQYPRPCTAAGQVVIEVLLLCSQRRTPWSCRSC